MTLSENLQIGPELYEFYTHEDNTLLSLIFSSKFKIKALYFGFLNLNPKAML
jgi:hypothetical protein